MGTFVFFVVLAVLEEGVF